MSENALYLCIREIFTLRVPVRTSGLPNECKTIQSTVMTAQMQHRFFFLGGGGGGGGGREIAWPSRFFREKKQQQIEFRLHFKVFTDVDNRERAKKLDKTNRISFDEKHKNCSKIMRNSSDQCK